MPGLIRTVAETGSTNADLLTEAAAGAPEGVWLRAERQSGGRGRMTRNWASPPGNLYASTIVRPVAGDPPAASLSLVAGIALQEVAAAWMAGRAPDSTEREDMRATPWLKWPNDLYVGAAKFAGILLERSGEAVVAGFGVNLAHAPALPDRATASLSQPGAASPDPGVFLDDLATAFARRLRQWRSGGIAVVREAWLTAAHPIGTALGATTREGRLEGLFAGLDPDGNLLLALPDGTTATINAGDVFLI